jgi:ADP-heptose:LPS heptosyltransferase
MLLFIKFSNAFLYITNLLLFFPSLRYVKTNPRTLLLIRLDAIGDYILFRNYLEVIRNSKRFRDCKITLCGNIIWKDVAEAFDKRFVDEFIWVDRKLFCSNTGYRFNLLKQVRQSGFETVIDTAYSREILYGDTIVMASGANVKIGSEGAKDKHVTWKRRLFSNVVYTEIIPAGSEDVFEFCRNKGFVSKILKEDISLVKSVIEVSGIVSSNKLPTPYVVLFFGASNANKIWDIKNFIEVGRYLISEYGFHLVLAGGKQEKLKSHLFYKALPADKLTDLCGNISIPELAKIISDSSLLISNESMATHIAASVNKTFVCVTNGERILRFHPYPHDIFDKAFYIYPDEIPANLNNKECLDKYRFGSDLDINKITEEKVKTVINKIMQDSVKFYPRLELRRSGFVYDKTGAVVFLNADKAFTAEMQ